MFERKHVHSRTNIDFAKDQSKRKKMKGKQKVKTFKVIERVS